MTTLLRKLKDNWLEWLFTVIWLPSIFGALLSGNFLLAGAVTVAGLVAFAAIAEAEKRAKKRKPIVHHGEPFTAERAALIFTVGMQKDTLLYSIEEHKPQAIGFLCTEKSRDVAKSIVNDLGLSEGSWWIECCDIRDIQNIRLKTRILFDWLFGKGFDKAGVALDVTGGMTVMSVGAFSVSQELQIDSQYTRSEFDGSNRPIRGTQEAIFVSCYYRLPPAVAVDESATQIRNDSPTAASVSKPAEQRLR